MTKYSKPFPRKTLSGFIFALMGAGLSTPGLSEENPGGIVLPVPEQQSPPMFRHESREGLVRLRFTITPEGETEDVEILDGFTDESFNQAAIETVQEWTYEPAKVDDENIAYHNREFVMSFPLTQEPTVTDTLRESYPEIEQQVENGEHDAAIDRIQTLLDGDIATLADYALLHDLMATAYLEKEAYHQALEHSRKATTALGPQGTDQEPLGYLLPPELLEAALRKRVLLAASLAHNKDALWAYDRLDALYDLPADDPLHERVEQVRANLESDEPMGQLARITDNTWTYTPMRRTFAVAEVDGELDSIDLYCDRRSAQLEFQEGVEWTLPEVFGECDLAFNGEEGTTFTFYEFQSPDPEG